MKKLTLFLCLTLAFAMGLPEALASTVSVLQSSIRDIQQVVETASVPTNFLLQPASSWLDGIRQEVAVALRQNHLQEYNDDYYAARGYQDSALQAADIAQKFLDKRDIADATKYRDEARRMEQAWHYYEDAAFEVWQGNLSQAQSEIKTADQVLNGSICLTAQAVSQGAAKISHVGIVGKAVCYEMEALNYAVDYDYAGAPAVVKDAVLTRTEAVITAKTGKALVSHGIPIGGGVADVAGSVASLSINIGQLATTIDTDSSPSQDTSQLIAQRLQTDNQTSANIEKQFSQFSADISSFQTLPNNKSVSQSSLPPSTAPQSSAGTAQQESPAVQQPAASVPNTQPITQNITPPSAPPPTPISPPTLSNTVAPTAHIMATNTSISSGGSTSIYWTSTNVGTCTVSPTNWSGTTVPQSSGYLQVLTNTQTYTLTCMGQGGTVLSSVTVTVAPSSAPTPTTALPTDWISLLSQHAADWNAKGSTWGYITDTYGMTRWYQLEGNSWVQVSSEAEAKTPYSSAPTPPIWISTSNSNYQFSVGTPAHTNQIYLQAGGGTAPYTWSVTGMPPGISINSSAGTLNGTPTTVGSFPVAFTATDATGRTGTQSYVFVIAATSLTITDIGGNPVSSLPSGVVGASYHQTLFAGGGSQNGYVWSVQGSLPPGLTTSCPPHGVGSSCALAISGTPTQAGTYTFGVRVTDSFNTTAQQNVTIIINTGTPPQIGSPALTQTTVGQPYSYTFTATGGSGGYQWSFAGSSPDPGLQLSLAGILSGTVANPNDCQGGIWYGPGVWQSLNQGGTPRPSTSFTVTVKDSSGQSVSSQPLCLVAYYPQPQVTNISPQSITIDGAQHVLTVNGSNFRSDATVGISAAGIPVPTTYIGPTSLSFTMYPNLGAGGPGFITTPSSRAVFGAGSELVSVFQSYSNLSNKVGWTISSP